MALAHKLIGKIAPVGQQTPGNDTAVAGAMFFAAIKTMVTCYGLKTSKRAWSCVFMHFRRVDAPKPHATPLIRRRDLQRVAVDREGQAYE